MLPCCFVCPPLFQLTILFLLLQLPSWPARFSFASAGYFLLPSVLLRSQLPSIALGGLLSLVHRVRLVVGLTRLRLCFAEASIFTFLRVFATYQGEFLMAIIALALITRLLLDLTTQRLVTGTQLQLLLLFVATPAAYYCSLFFVAQQLLGSSLLPLQRSFTSVLITLVAQYSCLVVFQLPCCVLFSFLFRYYAVFIVPLLHSTFYHPVLHCSCLVYGLLSPSCLCSVINYVTFLFSLLQLLNVVALLLSCCHCCGLLVAQYSSIAVFMLPLLRTMLRSVQWRNAHRVGFGQ